MTWLYFWNEKEQTYGRFDFDYFRDEDEDEDIWSFIARVSDELWNVLPPDADIRYEENAPSDYETFVHLTDLIDWLDDGYLIEFGE